MPRKALVAIDRIDARLLDAVQIDNRLTGEKLSERAHLSPTACQRRLARLRAEGVIESDIAVISPDTVGRPLSMLVFVTLERERFDIVDRFKRAIRATPEIMSGYYVTGEVDFALIVTARSMDDYEEFTSRFFHQNPDIKVFKTMVVIDRVKASFSLPIEPNI